MTSRPRGSPSATGHRRHRVPIILGFVVIVCIFGALGYWGWQHFFENRPAAGVSSTGPGTVDVPEGATGESVAKQLEEARVISSASDFLAHLKVVGGADAIKPGRYTLRAGQSFDSIIAALKEGGMPLTVKITVPEGLSIDQAARRIATQSAIASSSYLALAHEPGHFTVPNSPGRPAHPADLEGFLFPSTYELSPQEGAEQLIDQQLKAFTSKTAPLPWKQAPSKGITPYQALIVASLIEKEARVPEERAKIAAVIYNRLQKNMPLGIDATVRFALGKWTGSLTKTDLAVDSPYNTRKRKGLPPGPISSPGLAAMRAALAPAKVDSLYYVLADEQGHHFFTASYQDFLKAQSKIPTSSR
jgi:UPF0755 protein